jgi:proteasome accessory factor B
MKISESDLFTLCIAEKALDQYRGTPLYGKLEAVFRKLAAMLPEEVQVNASWLGEGYTFLPDSSTAIRETIWETVAAALRERKALEIEHRKASGEVTCRVVRPYHVASYHGEWYLIAHCAKRNEVLRFAMSRITEAVLTKERYEIPGDFNFAVFMGESFGIMDEGTTFTARVAFTPDAAPYVAERTWHAHQEIWENADGSLVLSFPAASMLEVRRWVLSWGAGAKVLEPDDLALEVRDELGKALERYR